MAFSQRRVNPGYQIDEDADQGFKDAVKGNQNNMALRYLLVIVERQNDQIRQLQAQVQAIKSPTKPKAQLTAKKDDSATVEETSA